MLFGLITKRYCLCVGNRMRCFAFVILGSILLGLCSCNREKQVVVRVYDKKLTSEELQNMTPISNKKTDSIEIQQRYIDSWIARQVMLHEAEKNLSSSKKKFDKQIQEYKESLLIDAYENQRVKQLLDTIVTDEEIIDYYLTNKMYFSTKKAIVKVNYIKLPINFSQLGIVKKILFKNERSQQEKEKLNSICENTAINLYMSDDWLLFDDILKEIPIVTYNNNELFLEKNKTLELRDTSGVYLVNFLKYKMIEENVLRNEDKEAIVRSILQQRRVGILKTLRKEALQRAKEAGEIMIGN